jgi:CheY-like chemotaxis protein
MQIWLVDDSRLNRQSWLHSFPKDVQEQHNLSAFASVAELIERLNSGPWPEILFVDYFLDGDYGTTVLDYFSAQSHEPPLLIAYSSLDRANDGMLQSGAHLKFAKQPAAMVQLSIRDRIPNAAALTALLAQKKPRT